MPSLVYITRIRPPSPELAQALESSGFHVKCFGPGEITADECVLVMTSEAVLTGLPVSELAAVPRIGTTQGAESQSTTQLHDIQKQLGAEAAIWNCIKAAGLGEPAVRASAAVSGPQVSAADDLGFVASQTALRVLEASQKVPGSPSLTVAQKSAVGSDHGLSAPVREPEAGAALSSNRGPSAGEIRKPGARYKQLWQPSAIAATLLILAIILLAGRAAIFRSTADVAAVDSSNSGARTASDAPGLSQTGSTLRTQPTQPTSQRGASIKPSNLAADGERHISDYDFVAEDYTTHFDLNGRRASPARHGTQSRTIPRRIVVD